MHMKRKNITWSPEMTEVVLSIQGKRPDLRNASAIIHAALVAFDQTIEEIQKPKTSAIMPPEWPPLKR